MSDETTETWWETVLAGSGGDIHATAGEEYLVLPKPTAARVVVDRNEPRAVRDAMDRMVASRTNFGPAKSLVGGATALVGKRKPAWTVSAGHTGETLRSHLANVLDTDLRVSVAVGPPRPNRKPIVRCYGPQGLFAVAKLGPDPHTAEMVQNEARWLDELAANPLADIKTPELLHSGEFSGSALLVMGALDLVSDLGIDFDDVPVKVAQALTERGAQGGSLHDSQWWQSLASRMDDPLLSSAQTQLRALSEHPDLSVVATSAWHGDWSPWNMGLLNSGDLCIWDWERAALGIPTGFDLLHLHYQYGVGLDGATGDLNKMGVPPEHHNIVKQLYMFELCARHNEAQALKTERHAKVMSTLEALQLIGTAS